MKMPKLSMVTALELLLLGLILALAAYLRLVNVVDTPGWYTDEGTHLAIARGLASATETNGRFQYLAINQSTLLFAKMPLFEWLLAAVVRWRGLDMSSLRLLTGSLGVLSVGMLYGVVRLMQPNRWLALLSSLFLAIYPQAVIYSRFGFSYNLLPPLVLLQLFGLWRYMTLDTSVRRVATHQTKRPFLLQAALACGLGIISDLIMLAFIAPIVVIVGYVNWRDGLWAVPLTLLPFGLYAAWMATTVPEAFWFDLGYTFSRVSGLSLFEQTLTLAQNYTVLLLGDVWMLAGFVGLFLLRPLPLRWLVLAMVGLPFVVMGRSQALFSLSFYYMIPLLPFVALGAAALVSYGWAQMNMDGRWWQRAILGALVGVPLGVSTWGLVGQVEGGVQTAVSPFLLNPNDARKTAVFLNQRITPDDVVITSPGVAWLIEGKTADFQMAIAAEGGQVPHLPDNLPANRFRFDPRFANARYVVVDNLWRNWAVFHVPDLVEKLEKVERETAVFQAGQIQVYEIR
ncbi:MAG: hypothetical protein AAF614_04205 [Chloroflexota bacterium]